MPAVINVGGPLAWGFIVLVSAWALRAGKALAGRRRARRKELDDDALIHDPSARQPQYLQPLSATAIRMLIETGALPCAVLELADGCSGSSGSSTAPPHHRGTLDSPKTSNNATFPPPNLTSGSSAVPASPLAHQPPAYANHAARIVPPDLAAAVPCMPAINWVRALPSQEAWRTELTRTAAAAYAASSGGGGPALAVAGSPHGWSSSSSHGRDAAGAMSSGASAVPCAVRGQDGMAVQPEAQRRNDQVQLHADGGILQGFGNGGAPLSPVVGESQQHQRSFRSPARDPRVRQVLAPGCEAHGGSGVGALERWRISGSSAAGVGAAAAAAAATAQASASTALVPYPPRHALLVVLGRNERTVAAVTAAAAAAGFSRVGVWVGSAESFAATSLGGPRLPSISRHGLCLMLQLGSEPLFHVPSLVLDVRRPDERLLYGAIRGTVNIPADELAAALVLPAMEFRRLYGVCQPGPWDVVVVLSRSGRRAAWAAQVCLDAGLKRVFVYNEGVYGWRLEDRVKPYRAYDLGAQPPDPEPFTPEEPDEAMGFEELHALGLPMRQGPRPSRFSAVGGLAGGTAPAPTAMAIGGPADPAAATRLMAAQ